MLNFVMQVYFLIDLATRIVKIDPLGNNENPQENHNASNSSDERTLNPVDIPIRAVCFSVFLSTWILNTYFMFY